MLQLDNVRAGYGRVEVLHGVDLALEPGSILGLLGRNGAGKTTTIRAIMGLVDGLRGSIRLGGMRSWRGLNPIVSPATESPGSRRGGGCSRR